MINQYQIINYSYVGIPSTEVVGEEFHYLDLFELIGQQQFMTTFQLREKSEAYSEYGESVLGVIYYEIQTVRLLNANKIDGINIEQIKIESPDRSLHLEKRGNLKYGGIKVADIKSISFLPYKREMEFHSTGEKKVPNVVEIEVGADDLDLDVLRQNYLVSKYNSGVELVKYETEQLIGIMLGINDGRIDSRILNRFGFDEDDLKDDLNIWHHIYKVKERRENLSETDKKNYAEISNIRRMQTITKLFKEIQDSGLVVSDLKENGEILKKILKACESFRPNILLHGKKQVYWDINSYLHIALRHIRDYQLGNFTKKTPISYKPQDLETLIEKVVGCVKSEYQAYRLENPKRIFTRQGAMAVVFNGEHYNLRINPDGRLVQFHTLSSDLQVTAKTGPQKAR